MGSHTIHLPTNQELNPAIYIPGNCTAGQYGLTAADPCSTTANTNQRRLLSTINPAEGKFFSYTERGDWGGTGSYTRAETSNLLNHFNPGNPNLS